MDQPKREFEYIHDPDMIDDITEAAFLAQEWLGLGGQRPSTSKNVAAVDLYVADLVSRGVKNQEDADPEEQAFVLGCLWGECLVATFRWAWVKVKFDESNFVIGVASPDQSLVIYPFYYLLQCFDGERSVSIYQSFQVLSEPGRVPRLPPGTFENVMDHID